MKSVKTEDWDKHIPTELTKSSLDLDWRHLVVRNYKEPGDLELTDLPAVPDPFIAVVRSGDRELVGVDGDRPMAKARTRAGSVFIRPAAEPGQIGWTALSPEPVEALHLHIDLRFLNKIAEQSASGGGKIEILQRFAINDPVIAHVAEAVHGELYHGGPDAKMYAEMAAQFLAAHLIRFHATRETVFPVYGTGLTATDVKRVIDYIRAHIDQTLALETLASLVQMSPYHFSRLFKLKTGLSPHKYVVRERMRAAQHLLKTTRLGVLEVAYAVGYGSPSQFTQQFKRACGVSPAVFRREAGAKTQEND